MKKMVNVKILICVGTGTVEKGVLQTTISFIAGEDHFSENREATQERTRVESGVWSSSP